MTKLAASAIILAAAALSACAPAAGGVTNAQATALDGSDGPAGTDEADQAGEGSLPLRNARVHEETGSWLIQPKIVGGEEAVPGQDPWQVALLDARRRDRNVAFCGGSLVAPQWVVTAAHCVDRGTRARDVDVLSGTTDLDSGGQRIAISAIFIHRDYVIATNDSDIALLRLAAPSTARVIGMVTPQQDPQLSAADITVRTTGWGHTRPGGVMVRRLRTVAVPVVSNGDCNALVAYDGEVTDNMICAGWARGGADSCQGDSGGPLTAPLDADRALIGIVSWGESCAERNRYGVYTRVANYRAWLDMCIRAGPCPRQ